MRIIITDDRKEKLNEDIAKRRATRKRAKPKPKEEPGKLMAGLAQKMYERQAAMKARDHAKQMALNQRVYRRG